MRRHTVAVFFVVITLALPAIPAGAVNEYLCPEAAPSGFVDVEPASPFKPFIDCLVFWEITSGTTATTFDPSAPVNRWQMAVFMQRLWATRSRPLAPISQGFTDIGTVGSEAETAINQAAQLGITSGVAPGLYAPYEQVSRWQMAIFLARFARAARLLLPAPSPTEFTDVAGLSTEAQDSISIVRSLGITTGTSATTYSPNDVVTREQMAAFLIRTLQATWSLNADDFTLSCNTDSQGVETCTGSGEWFAGVPLRFLHTWFIELPADTSGFDNPSTTAQFYIDGALQATTEIAVALPGVKYRSWEVLVPGGLTGSHTLEARYLAEGSLVFVDSATVTFD